MRNGLSGLRAYQEGGPVLDKLKRLWESIRGRADNPDWKDLPWHVAPITGELSDLVEIGAGLQDRDVGRIGLGLGALALPFVGAPALRKLFKGRKKIRPLDARGMPRPRLGPVEGPLGQGDLVEGCFCGRSCCGFGFWGFGKRAQAKSCPDQYGTPHEFTTVCLLSHVRSSFSFRRLLVFEKRTPILIQSVYFKQAPRRVLGDSCRPQDAELVQKGWK